MCQELGAARVAFVGLARDFEVGAVPPEKLAQALDHLGTIEKTAAVLASAVAARMASLGRRESSRKQAVRRLAKASGTSMKEADKSIAAAEQMKDQPEVEAVARAGGLSRQQAMIVLDAAIANPAATQGLLDKAATCSLSELAAEAAKARAAVTDPEARRREIRKRRSLRSYTDCSGTWHLHAQGLPEDGATVMAVIQPIADRLFDEARRQGRREPPGTYAFDALVGLARSGGGSTPPVEVLFRVDLDAFFRGYPADGEVIEVAGFGPTSAQAVTDVLEHGSPFLKAVMTKGKDVMGVVHLGRRPNAFQKTALDWLYPTCAVEGCGVRADWCETDHREPWAKTRFTLLDLLDRLCRAHHRMKTNEGWSLVEGKGKRPFVPSQDPRHPRFNKTVQPGTATRVLRDKEGTRGAGAGKDGAPPGCRQVDAEGAKAGDSS